MIAMKAIVGFSLPDGAAAAGSRFTAESEAAARRLETAGVAERVKADEKPKAPAKATDAKAS